MATHDPSLKLSELQIESILDRLVPLIARKEDEGFFRGVLHIKLSECTSGQAAYFVSQLLREARQISLTTSPPHSVGAVA